MSLFYQLFDEHTALLKNRGFDEKILNSPDVPGTLQKKFRHLLSGAINEALKLDQPSSFKLSTTGYFNDNALLIHYDLHYLFDPDKNTLSITQIDLSDNAGKRLTMHLKRHNYQLPHSGNGITMLYRPIIRRAEAGRLLSTKKNHRGKRN